MDEREKKKQMILENAIKVFSLEGYAGTDVDEIAKLSNVGKGTIYRYFGSKEQLFVESFIYIVKMFKKDTERILKGNLPLDKKIDGLIDQLIKGLKQKEQLLKLYILEIAKISRITSNKNRGFIYAKKFSRMELLTNFIKDEQDKGNITDAISARSLASMFIGSIQQVVGLYYMGYIKEFSEVEREIREIVNFIKKQMIKEEI